MDAEVFLKQIENRLKVDFYTGVPDSLLRPLCDVLLTQEKFASRHIVAADEGGAVGLAAGHYLATGKPSLVYMQNSGIGNAINPICSLIDNHVYAIPLLFVVGWRGEPGVHDEPQHVFQGMISRDLLECVGLEVFVVDAGLSPEDFAAILDKVSFLFAEGKSAALLMRKGALSSEVKRSYADVGTLSREKAVDTVTRHAPSSAAFVSTTGKLSRELFELRERHGEPHGSDFLTVGSMGHSPMIALGVALAHKESPVYVLDGDGALLMHTGALAIVASQDPHRFVHVLINNAAHETVGGMPTASPFVDYPALAKAMGYQAAYSAQDEQGIIDALSEAAQVDGPVFIEIRTDLTSRGDLGRPTTSAYENGRAFIEYLEKAE
ncbi:MAG: phosphonopyruvate decarboxylase [Raoultibacter sp.]